MAASFYNPSRFVSPEHYARSQSMLARQREAAKQFKKGMRVTVEGVGNGIVEGVTDNRVIVRRGLGKPQKYDPLKTTIL